MKILQPSLFNISGPYGVGKDTMLNHLLRQNEDRFHRVGTITTRIPTPDADPSYRFCTESDFAEITRSGRWIINQQLSGSTAYGTSVDEIERESQQGKVCLHSIFPGAAGAGRLRQVFGKKLVSIALLPTVGDQEMQIAELERRMIARGREDLPTIQKRLMAQKDQIAYILQNEEVQTQDGQMQVFDRILVNETLDIALTELVAYFRSRFTQL